MKINQYKKYFYIQIDYKYNFSFCFAHTGVEVRNDGRWYESERTTDGQRHQAERACRLSAPCGEQRQQLPE
ncbi:hypothetical protein NE579_09205 [Intestinimonas massiliensis]|uniref:Uncharacterized protein n=1 Tax=Intestinimonas massiliensis (ex Afouda et al. 2020) TaxID=1673721 RepID=A0AAW5JP72_9FIRM|nr:hypothetical protein [Intestinimonas massiliensis (ex Afouda et al. 2020)]MCQ4770640.1 hypothetical protein [Intestinimonas massiliensis (ex Afouda et al. 2020)]